MIFISGGVDYLIITDIVSLILYIMLLISFKRDQTGTASLIRKRERLATVVVLAAIAAVADIASSLLDGNPDFVIVNYALVNTISISSYINAVVVSAYEFDVMELEEDIAKNLKGIYQIIMTVCIVLNIVGSVFGKVIYYDDAGVYHRGEFWIAGPAVVFTILVINTVILLSSSVAHGQRFILVLYNVLPLVGVVLSYFNSAIPFIRISEYADVCLLSVVSYVDLSRETNKVEIELQTKKADLVMSQMKPHYIFNTITAATELCENDPPTAAKMLTNFAKYLRGNLDSIGNTAPIPFTKELGHIRAYAEIEQVSLGDGLKIEYDVSIKNFLVPPITVQPLVENAIKHGIAEGSGEGTVKLKTWEEPDFFCISVSDSGRGFDVNTPPKDDGRVHIGIESVKSRLRAFGAKIEIKSRIGEGTEITIKIPKNNK